LPKTTRIPSASERKLRKTAKEGESKFVHILLADDHKILRSGLRELIEKHPCFKIAAEAGDGRTAVRLCRELSPDVVLMDISMPELNGIEATRQILGCSPRTKVIILSMHSDRRFVEEVFAAGAAGYLLKSCTFEEIVSSIEAVSEGNTYLHPKIATFVHSGYLEVLNKRKPSSFTVLSSREREVLQLIAEGRNTKEIAFSFHLSIKTVEAHRRRIMDKLNIRNVAALTKYAIREGLTSEEG
jgi:DNA-binding NarL/FixJ family response regulator